jgi:hypothetical protein
MCYIWTARCCVQWTTAEFVSLTTLALDHFANDIATQVGLRSASMATPTRRHTQQTAHTDPKKKTTKTARNQRLNSHPLQVQGPVAGSSGVESLRWPDSQQLLAASEQIRAIRIGSLWYKGGRYCLGNQECIAMFEGGSSTTSASQPVSRCQHRWQEAVEGVRAWRKREQRLTLQAALPSQHTARSR